MTAAASVGGANPPPDDSRPVIDAVRRYGRTFTRPGGVLWWIARPMFLAGALVIAGIEIASGGSLLHGLAAAAIAVCVRTVRRPWVGLVAAVVSGVLVPGVGLMVAIRTLTGAAVILIAGPGWQSGLDRLVNGRRGVVDGTPTLEEGLAQLGGLDRLEENAAQEALGRAALAAWSTADGARMATTAVLFARLLLRGRAGAIQLPWNLALERLWLIEILTEFAPRVLAALLAVLLVLASRNGPLFIIDGSPVRIGLACGCAALLAQNLAKVRHGIPMMQLFSFLLPVAYGVLLVFVAGTDFWAVLILVLVAVAVARFTYTALAGRMFGRTPQRLRLPRRTGSAAGREKWRAALEALRLPGSPVPEQLWTQIQVDADESAGFRAGAAAALADLALRAGDLQRALTCADHARDLLADEPDSSMAPHVWAARGRVLIAVGDTREARGLLERAAHSRLYRGDRRLFEDIERAGPEAKQPTDDNRLSSTRADAVGALRTNIDKAVRDADVARLRELVALSDDDIEIDSYSARQALRDTLASGLLELGSLELRQGRPAKAAPVLRRASTSVTDPGDHAVARTLLGVAMATTVPHRAMKELAAGVRAIEQRRGTLSQGRLRGRLIAGNAAIYGQVFDAIERLQEHGARPDLAGEVIESLRRGALASTLRTGAEQLSGPLRHMVRRLAQLEAVESADNAAAIATIRADIGRELSDEAAKAYVPEPVRYDELRAAVAGMHVLAFHLHEAGPERVRGVAVWTSEEGSPTIEQFEILDPALLEVLGIRGEHVRRAIMDAPQDASARDTWRRLGVALLPTGLRTVLDDTAESDPVALLIVPDGLLAALPWAALRLSDGRPLLAAVRLQQIPSLGLLGPPRTADCARPRTVAVHLADGVSSGRERRTLAVLPVDLARTLEEFAGALTRKPAGAYFSAHGTDEGLAQAVTFGDGGQLSAAAALGQRWPGWVVFASCLVGRIQQRLGDEPLGLPISCLIGGAETVIGGVIEIRYTAGRQAARIAVRLADGEHPAVVLRQEQLSQFHLGEGAPLTAWAGLVCITRHRQ